MLRLETHDTDSMSSLGTMMHLLAHLIVLYRVFIKRNVYGISMQTQLMLHSRATWMIAIMVFDDEDLVLLDLTLVAFVASASGSIYYFSKTSDQLRATVTNEPSHNNMSPMAMYLMMPALSMFIMVICMQFYPGDYGALISTWCLETVALIPQIIMYRVHFEASVGMGCFLVLMGAYRLVSTTDIFLPTFYSCSFWPDVVEFHYLAWASLQGLLCVGVVLFPFLPRITAPTISSADILVDLCEQKRRYAMLLMLALCGVAAAQDLDSWTMRSFLCWIQATLGIISYYMTLLFVIYCFRVYHRPRNTVMEQQDSEATLDQDSMSSDSESSEEGPEHHGAMDQQKSDALKFFSTARRRVFAVVFFLSIGPSLLFSGLFDVMYLYVLCVPLMVVSAGFVCLSIHMKTLDADEQSGEEGYEMNDVAMDDSIVFEENGVVSELPRGGGRTVINNVLPGDEQRQEEGQFALPATETSPLFLHGIQVV